MQEQAGATTANLLTGLGIDEYLTRTDEAGRRGFLTDALGSTIALTADTGAVLTEYTYDPFGATSASGEASANPFQYTGREHDGATGLYFYRTRYYSPTLHRFISEDRLEVEPWETNLYAYVGNDPVSFVDPYGEATTLPMPLPRPLPGWAGVLVAGLAILAMLLQYLIDMLLSQLAASGSGRTPAQVPARGPHRLRVHRQTLTGLGRTGVQAKALMPNQAQSLGRKLATPINCRRGESFLTYPQLVRMACRRG